MSGRQAFQPFDGLIVLENFSRIDDRGHLTRLFDLQGDKPIRSLRLEQVNVTRTSESGTVRGLHMQDPSCEETKVVTCLEGAVFDVVVDLRLASSTFGMWFGVELYATKLVSVWIPPGCAHGVQTLIPGSLVHYMHSSHYSPEREIGINPLDGDIAIDWPLEPRNLSARDRNLPNLRESRVLLS